MNLPPDNYDTPWGFIEWALTSISAVIVFIGGMIFKGWNSISIHKSKLDAMDIRISNLEKDSEEIKDRGMVTRDELDKNIKEFYDRLENRFNKLDTKFDRLLDYILNK